MKTLNTWIAGACLGLGLLTALGAVLSSTQAAPPDKDELPPGLQKKDKLPPGWQKKVGRNQNSDGATTTTNGASGTANTTITTTTTTTSTSGSGSGSVSKPLPPKTTTEVVKVPAPPSNGGGSSTPTTTTTPGTTGGSTTPAIGTTPLQRPLTAQQRENLTRMERALSALEVQAVRPGAPDRLLHRLSNHLNIPMATLQSQLKEHPGLTVSHLYLANVIAKEGHVTSEQVLQQRKAGTSWADIVRNLRVPFSDMADRLRAAEDAAREAANEEAAKVRKQAARTN